jgi:hypothetical protein
MSHVWALALLLAAGPQLPPMSRHTHPSGAFSFEAPVGWSVRPVEGEASLYEAVGDGQIVRFVYTPGEVGFDALHVSCMLERLRPEAETSPRIRYEYDFLGGSVGEFNILDSAFEVRYDAEVNGSREWRQRNVTLVGKGRSLCVILHAPAKTWKRSRPARALQEAILRSVLLP